jgi:hypothetical protein
MNLTIYALFIKGTVADIAKLPSNNESKTASEYHLITSNEQELFEIIELVAPGRGVGIMEAAKDGGYKNLLPVDPSKPKDHTQLFYQVALATL